MPNSQLGGCTPVGSYVLVGSGTFHALRLWVDRWKLLGSPDVEIARAWNEKALTVFRDSVFCVLSEDSSLCTFEDFRKDLVKRVTLAGGRDLASSDEYIPSLPSSHLNLKFAT